MIYIIDEGNSLGWFSLNAKSGLLSIAAHPIDAEAKQTVVIIIAAEDQANIGTRRRITTTVTLSIIDCNDNVPQFEYVYDPVIVTENQVVGTEISRVTAHDIDAGDNGRVIYSIANIDHVPFMIDHMTGVIMSTDQLDYETMSRQYHLQVRASDRGTPYRRENETVIDIEVRDVNDNAPRFEQANCVGYVTRDAPLGTKMMVVSAVDIEPGNIISYRIIGGNTQNCFEMVLITGSLNLDCDISYFGDLLSSWSLLVTANDGKHDADPLSINITLVNADPSIQLSTSFGNINCQKTSAIGDLLMQKEDQNEAESQLTAASYDYIENVNRPVFSHDIVTHLEIPENLPIGHELSTLTASDPDPGYNGMVNYVITSGNQQGKFKVDTYSGSLYLISALDRESTVQYTLEITVCDMGKPAKFNSITVEIVLLDINDNVPVFEKEVYHILIHENR